MKLTHPFVTAMIAGTLSATASFALHAVAQGKPEPVIAAPQLESAIFAGGCFWCVESDFDKVEGVVETISGYTGGTTTNPTYKNHTKDGHLEAVKVVYDPSLVSYETLVDYFLHHIDPTDAGGQFCDRGNSYTTAVFVASSQERDVVEDVFEDARSEGVLPAPIVTKIRDAAPFYAAESYHQDYYLKNSTRYEFYRTACGRDKRVKAVWAGPGNS